MPSSPCRRCGSQPTLEAVRIAYQPCYRLVCPCGFNGAARMTELGAYDAWEQLQTLETRGKGVTMKAVILPVLAILALFPAFALAGDETRLYDRSGRYQGRATTNTANPSQQSLYDNHGNYLGRAMTKPDGSVKVYDNHGNFKGSSLPGRTNTPTNKE